MGRRVGVPARKLEKRVALITGAGRGIGRAIALGYAREGARIAATARTTSELDSLSDEIRREGGEALSITADLEKPGDPAQVVRQVEERFGNVEILVNNAGIGSGVGPKPVVDFDDGLWHRTLALNLTAPYLLCKAVLPRMLRKKWGRIINISSVMGKAGSPLGSAYSVSKHGLLGLTRTLALEVARDGITVNAICPGAVNTAQSDQRLRFNAEQQGVPFDELLTRLNPLGRRLEPNEIAPMAILLASDEAAAITGQAINVCGGYAMF
jgi:NAD(P)-dependent dehydrogenase (short-subunit alcohol dehydrogenase family)